MQVAHIGLSGGLHEKSINEEAKIKIMETKQLQPFHGKIHDNHLGTYQVGLKVHNEGYGGWGHPADHEHCIKLFENKKKKRNWKNLFHIA